MSLIGFGFFFMILRCLIKMFWEYCHFVICINDTFFKDKYHEILFIVIRRDGNNQIYLVVFDISRKVETKTWTLFTRGLHRCIGGRHDLSIIAHWENAINIAITNVFPIIHHSFCNQHLKGYMCVRYTKTKVIERLFWVGMCMIWFDVV